MPRRARPPSEGRSVTHLTPPGECEFPSPDPALEYRNRSLTFDGSRVLRSWGPVRRPFVVAVERAGHRWRVEGFGVDASGARSAVRSMFNLGHRLAPFYRQVRAEPTLRGMEREGFGLRPPRDASLYESLLYAIVGQQLSVRAATTLRERLDAATEAKRSIGGVEVAVPPDPRRLMRLGVDGLRGVGLSRAKASAIVSLAEREIAGSFRGERFDRQTSEAVVAALDAEPGVGRWTAENAVLRGLGRTDVFVAGDLGVRMALGAYWGRSAPVPEEEARDWAARHFPGWGSYATLYLWRRWVLDGTPRPGRGALTPRRAIGEDPAGRSRSPDAAPRRGGARSP
ncbi:MAG TPA: hypothetical protein VGS23_06250 [Thermoplasmata archaeon]|nr:hypothetical protein [Thermoplasmata archaeon]